MRLQSSDASDLQEFQKITCTMRFQGSDIHLLKNMAKVFKIVKDSPKIGLKYGIFKKKTFLLKYARCSRKQPTF